MDGEVCRPVTFIDSQNIKLAIINRLLLLRSSLPETGNLNSRSRLISDDAGSSSVYPLDLDSLVKKEEWSISPAPETDSVSHLMRHKCLQETEDKKRIQMQYTISCNVECEDSEAAVEVSPQKTAAPRRMLTQAELKAMYNAQQQALVRERMREVHQQRHQKHSAQQAHPPRPNPIRQPSEKSSAEISFTDLHNPDKMRHLVGGFDDSMRKEQQQRHSTQHTHPTRPNPIRQPSEKSSAEISFSDLHNPEKMRHLVGGFDDSMQKVHQQQRHSAQQTHPTRPNPIRQPSEKSSAEISFSDLHNPERMRHFVGGFDDSTRTFNSTTDLSSCTAYDSVAQELQLDIFIKEANKLMMDVKKSKYSHRSCSPPPALHSFNHPPPHQRDSLKHSHS
uniref:Uncharacterized protein n=1 Tax=Ditylum brightwellii TaxID=49249 RepID=A0A6V2FYH0_9STRA